MKPRILVYSWSFMGIKDPNLDSRIYEELSDLSRNISITVVAENTLSNQNGNLSLNKIPQNSLPIIQNLFRFFGYSLATIRLRKKYDLIFVRTLNLLFLFCGIIAKKILQKKLVIWLSSSRGRHKGIVFYSEILVRSPVFSQKVTLRRGFKAKSVALKGDSALNIRSFKGTFWTLLLAFL